MSHPQQATITELGSVVDALPGLVWTALPDSRVDFVNHQWREYIGVSSLHSSGDAWQMAIHPEDRPRLLECLRSSISSRNSCEAEVRMRRFDGQFRWFAVRANPITDASGAAKMRVDSVADLVKAAMRLGLTPAKNPWHVTRESV
jgi:PAS domain S-box-containing protein